MLQLPWEAQCVRRHRAGRVPRTLMATAAFLITTSPGPGFGVGASPTLSGLPLASVIQAAWFFVIVPSIGCRVFNKGWTVALAVEVRRACAGDRGLARKAGQRKAGTGSCGSSRNAGAAL